MNAADPSRVSVDSHELLCEELPAWDGLRRSFSDPVMLNDDRVLQNLLIIEDHCLPNAKYFDFQPEIKPFMRRILTSWMLEVIPIAYSLLLTACMLSFRMICIFRFLLKLKCLSIYQHLVFRIL